MIVLVIVVAVVGVAAVLLARTVQEAQAINAKAQNIAVTGRGINEATDSIVQLNRTNDLAESILGSARPLDTQLGRIVATATGIDTRAASINSKAGSINTTAGSINDSAGTINTNAGEINAAAGEINSSAGSINSSAGAINSNAGSIDRSAGAINSSAGSINSSAGDINSSAGDINDSVVEINDTAVGIDSTAGSILGTARKIDTDVELINTNLDVTLDLVTQVKGDTGNILGQAGEANQTAACIDRKLFGEAGDDGDCQGRPQDEAPAPSDEGTSTSLSRKELGRMLDEPPKKNEEKAERAEKAEKAEKAEVAEEPKDEPKERPKKRRRAALPLIERLPANPTTEQLNDIVDELVPGLLGPGRDRTDEPPPRDVLERLLPELPLLGR